MDKPNTQPNDLVPPTPAETADLRYLDAAGLVFSWVSGSLRMEIAGEAVYDKVKIVRAFPLSAPQDYLSVYGSHDKEIGLIRGIAGLDKASRLLVEKELERRYFVPAIERVISTRMQFGVVVWDVETDRGRCTFSTRNLRDNVVRPSPGRFLLTDVDNNRYDIVDIAAMDPQSQSLLLQHI